MPFLLLLGIVAAAIAAVVTRLKAIEDSVSALAQDVSNDASTLLSIEAAVEEIAAHFSG